MKICPNCLGSADMTSQDGIGGSWKDCPLCQGEGEVTDSCNVLLFLPKQSKTISFVDDDDIPF